MKGICTVKHSLVRLGAIEIGSVRIGYNNRSSPRDLHIQMWISLLLIIPEKWFNNQNNLWSRLMKLCDVCMEISNQPYYHYWLYVTISISTYDVCHLHRSHFNLHHFSTLNTLLPLLSIHNHLWERNQNLSQPIEQQRLAEQLPNPTW